MIATEALYLGRLVRSLKGSDLLLWGEGEVRVWRNRIAILGVSPRVFLNEMMQS